jgi:hypothetical protein
LETAPFDKILRDERFIHCGGGHHICFMSGSIVSQIVWESTAMEYDLTMNSGRPFYMARNFDPLP